MHFNNASYPICFLQDWLRLGSFFRNSCVFNRNWVRFVKKMIIPGIFNYRPQTPQKSPRRPNRAGATRFFLGVQNPNAPPYAPLCHRAIHDASVAACGETRETIGTNETIYFPLSLWRVNKVRVVHQVHRSFEHPANRGLAPRFRRCRMLTSLVQPAERGRTMHFIQKKPNRL